MEARTIVVGVGNPLLTDDGVGIRVARLLRERLERRERVDVVEACLGGMSLMEALEGYDRAIVVDAMLGGGDPGTVYRGDLESMFDTKNSACPHDATLSEALAVGRALGLALPARVEVVGVEPVDVSTFSEALTGPVERAVPGIVAELADRLSGRAGEVTG